MDIISWWPQKSEVSYSLSKSRIQTTNDDTTINRSYTSGFSITVLDSTEESYRLKWAYEQGAYLGEIVDALPQVGTLLEEVANMEVEYLAYPEGGFLGLEDFEGIKAKMEAVFTSLGNSSEELSSESSKQVISNLTGTTLANEERLVGTYLRELQLYHGFYGIQLEIGDTLRYEESYPNPFGGAPFTGEGLLFISERDVERGTFEVRNEVIMDPETTMEILGETFRKLLAGQDGVEEKIQAMMEQVEFDIYTEIRATYEEETGWIEALSFMRTTKAREADRLSTRTDKSLISRIK